MSKYRKMLSSWEAPYLQSLIKLMESQSKTTLIMWVLDYAEMALLPIWVNERVEDVRPHVLWCRPCLVDFTLKIIQNWA